MSSTHRRHITISYIFEKDKIDFKKKCTNQNVAIFITKFFLHLKKQNSREKNLKEWKGKCAQCTHIHVVVVQ